MPLLYNTSIQGDGSYTFTTAINQIYLVYFLNYILIDVDGNQHEVYNFVFTPETGLNTEKFSRRYDEKIKNTIISIIDKFFFESENRVLIYTCFSDDDLARNRSIIFNKWCKDLNNTIEIHPKNITTINNSIYSSCLIIKDNPLKKLILDAFDLNMDELMKANN